MQEASLIIGLCAIIIMLVNSFNYKINQFGSDHHFHLNLIGLIKNNKHKLLHYYHNFLGSTSIAYPQLFHWLFSFFSQKNIAKKIFIYKSLIYFLDVAFFLLFFYSDLVAFKSTKPLLNLCLYESVLFIFTPFNYVRWNATNAGLSPRSLGVLLGRLFVYAFLFYLKSHSWLAFALMTIVCFVVYLSSQFALQYIIFLCFIYGMFSFKLELLLVPFAGFLLFFIANTKVALLFIKGQYQHKKTYATFFAKRFILKYRPSIWRDFVYDFWKKLVTEKWKALPYIQYNAVITIFWGFTILPITIIYFFKIGLFSSFEAFTNGLQQSPFLSVVFVTIGIFLLTSFRITRFLGEPERYIEFVLPVIVVLFMQSFSSAIIYYAVLFYITVSFLLLIINKFYSKHIAVNTNSTSNVVATIEINSLLNKVKIEKGDLRIFSNNEEVLRMLLNTNYNFLIPDIQAKKTGSFYYCDIYNNHYPQINTQLLEPMINEFMINIFIEQIKEGVAVYKPHNSNCIYSNYGFNIYQIGA